MFNIVIITDYTDVAYNEVRGKIISLANSKINRDYNIEPCVAVKPFSIINGAFLLRLLLEDYAKNTIFVCLLCPRRERINGKWWPEKLLIKLVSGYYIFASNNGIANWVLEYNELKEIVKLSALESTPFGGKFILPQYIAKLIDAKEARLKGFCSPFPKENLYPNPFERDMVVHIDNFGLIKINTLFDSFNFKPDAPIVIEGYKDGAKAYSYRGTFARKDFRAYKAGTILIRRGSSFDLIELCKVRRLNPFKEIEIGDIIKISQDITGV